MDHAAIRLEKSASGYFPRVTAAGSAAHEPVVDNTGPCWSWKLTRNCAMRPIIFLLHVGAIVGLNAATGLAFWAMGYPLVAVFCAFPMAVLAVATVVYGLHAAGEHVELTAKSLCIQTHRGLSSRMDRLHPRWTRLERGPCDRPLLLCSGRQRILVGCHLSPAQRKRFAAELSRCLAQLARPPHEQLSAGGRAP